MSIVWGTMNKCVNSWVSMWKYAKSWESVVKIEKVWESMLKDKKIWVSDKSWDSVLYWLEWIVLPKSKKLNWQHSLFNHMT